MKMSIRMITYLAASVWLGGSIAWAQEGSAVDQFEAPVELLAGGKAIQGAAYPSPTLYDLDGDGQRELVVGDLVGNIFVSKKSEKDSAQWGELGRLEADGEPIKLNNW